MAHALVSDLGLAPEVQSRVDAAFEKLRQLVTPRNLVAHNPPVVHVYWNDKTGEVEMSHELRSAKDPSKDITIEELQKLYGQSVDLAQELALLYGVVSEPKSRLKKP